MFTRLLFSVVQTGIAPVSFYELPPDGSRPRAHYDGLPVDFIASAMQQIGAVPHADFKTYNVINMHADDGISLDRIIDWVASADIPSIDSAITPIGCTASPTSCAICPMSSAPTRR